MNGIKKTIFNERKANKYHFDDGNKFKVRNLKL